MEGNLLSKAFAALQDRKRRRRWSKVVSALACVVVFCTTYALILPAITLAGTSYCGLEEHTHVDTCYTDQLVCQVAEGEGHTHTQECYTQQQVLSCGLEESEGHTHDASCVQESKTLSCGLEESSGHTHSDACYDGEGNLICTEEEREGHSHSDDCYTVSQSYVCGLEESEGHTHSESCYETQSVLTCQLEETEGHVHTDACYEQVQTCTLEEHTHTQACFSNPEADVETAADWEKTLPEELTGVWADDVIAVAESQLGYQESEKNYSVTEDGERKGYTRYGAWYGDSYGDWCAMFVSFCLNYAQVEDFPLEASCQRWVNLLSGQESLVVAGEKVTYDFYRPAADYTPVPGDLIFFDTDAEDDVDNANHVGLVVEVTEATDTRPAQVKTIEGNSANRVQYQTYELDDETILGYAQLPEKPVEETEEAQPETEGVIIPYTCALEEHTHSDACYGEDGSLTCGLEEHTHSDACLPQTVSDTYYCGLEEHTHSDACGEDCTIEEHTHGTACTVDLTGLSDGDRAVVEHVIGLIEEMPSADEIDAKIEEFEEAEDYDGEEAYLTQVFGQVKAAYAFYSRLTDDLKLLVPNSAKLAELEYIWSATTYAATNTIPVYQINSYYPTSSTDPSAYAVIMLRGGSFDELCQKEGMLDFAFNYWDAIVVEEGENGNLYIAKYDTSTGDKSEYKAASENGFVLIFTVDSTHSFYLSNLDIKVGDYVSVDFDYTSYTSGSEAKYNDTTYGYVTFSTSAPTVDPEGANPVTTVKAASTSDFIELNLYEYYGPASAKAAGKSSVNDLWVSGPAATGYPGFQWNGGAYAKYAYTNSGALSTAPYNTYYVDRNYVDDVDFGNSMITDYDFDPNTTYGQPSNSHTAVGWINSGWGDINYLDSSTYGVTNRPIGMSIGWEVLDRKLNEDGYPQLKDKSFTTGTGSLGYLFSENEYATKVNSSSIDGLFQYDEITGMYSYNSRKNHAQYNSSTNTFTLYNQIITPNFILYPFGNFLPFNDITDGNKASLIGRITVDGKEYGYNYAGGAKQYIETIMGRLDPVNTPEQYKNYYYNTEQQLYNMLDEYKSNWSRWSGTNGTDWLTATTADLIDDYFNASDYDNMGTTPSTGKVSFATMQAEDGSVLINKMYNIDYNVDTDFFFGMDMKMNFYQPKGGMTGKDQDGDSDFDSPMEFYFTGDDDVWVYIDGVLFLDLSGIHRHVGGKIDFVNGRVYYYYLDTDGDGDVNSTYTPAGATGSNDYYTFAELLKASGIAEADLGKYLKKDDSGNYTTFLDYSTHSFKFYYMERGSGSSVCRLNFNFPLIQQNTITVEKELATDKEDIEVLGDPDFTFQVLDEETNNPFFATHDKVKKWAYSLYDENGNAIQSVRVVNKNPDGTIKTLEVYQGNILLLKKVDNKLTHYNDDGTVRTDPNPRLLTTDENSYFTLKAGQRAEFVGIAEHWGKYYVREILPDGYKEQYGEIKITGETTSKTFNGTAIGAATFEGADSNVEDASASNTFKFTNTVATAKLGSLSVTKKLDAAYSGDTSKSFAFNVTLDGEPLPVGTSYTVASEDGTETTATVTTAGQITLTADQTALISNILAGTQFEVTETEESAKGYFVSYSVGDATDSIIAKGVVGVEETVAVTVTNSEIGITVDIPIAKTMSYFGNASRSYRFKIEQVADQNGTALNPAGYSDTVTLDEPTSDYTKGTFKINYTQNDVPTNETKTFYYKVSEVEDTEAVRYDTKYYIVKVDVTNTNDVMEAKVTDIWQVDGGTTPHTAGSDMTDTTILFTNTILRNLTVSKTVAGTTNVDREFEFTLKLEAHQSNAELPTALVGIKTDASGSKSKVSYSLVDGVATFTLKNGESVKFTNIPYRSKWALTEKAEDGYLTTYTITANDKATEYAGNTAENQVANAANTTVAFTNAVTYSLPEAGGAGTYLYTLGGALLMTATPLVYGYSQRRKREGRADR